MKAVLELDLSAQLQKKYYRIKTNAIIANTKPIQEYPIENICYTSQDAHHSIIHDVVIGYSQHTSPNQLIYSVLFDQITHQHSVIQFIQKITSMEVFRKKNITVSHFLIHGNDLYDYHSANKYHLNAQSARAQQTFNDETSAKDDNFDYLFKREINLCEEIKPHRIAQVINNVTYLQIEQFFTVQIQKKEAKTQNLNIQELQNKKVLEFFILKIGANLRINLILLNHNKNYGFTAEEKKEFKFCLMMYEGGLKPIKYQTTKVQLIHNLLKGIKTLFYYCYFPGTSLLSQDHTNLSNSRYKKKYPIINSTYTSSFSSTHNSIASTPSRKSPNKNSPVDLNAEIKQYFDSFFNNLMCLRNKDKQSQQQIVKIYLQRKQKKLKCELQRLNDKVRQLNLKYKVEKGQVSQIRKKMIKNLQKSAKNIIELKKMGISNVEKHMMWIQGTVEEKKQMIKDEYDEIQSINQRIIESKRKHQYFVGKMQAYKKKLQQKKYTLTSRSFNKQNLLIFSEVNGKQPSGLKNEQNLQLKLSESQMDYLEQYKQGLKQKMHSKLKQSHEKKIFMENMDEIRKKVGKLEISKLEQKYFELFQD